MKKQISDEQLDSLMRELLDDALADDQTVNDIADASSLWWGVQRNVNAQKQTQASAWPPIARFWRRGWINLPTLAALAAAVVVISLFALRPQSVPEPTVNTVAKVERADDKPVVTLGTSSDIVDQAPALTKDKISTATAPTRVPVVTSKLVSKPTVVRTAATAAPVTKEPAEIKTDFIALSYARNPESGQIVRVKVPSSMMVTLGLVSAVEKPSAMVDAEVVVGDDGLTHAIRFIR